MENQNPVFLIGRVCARLARNTAATIRSLSQGSIAQVSEQSGRVADDAVSTAWNDVMWRERVEGTVREIIREGIDQFRVAMDMDAVADREDREWALSQASNCFSYLVTSGDVTSGELLAAMYYNRGRVDIEYGKMYPETMPEVIRSFEQALIYWATHLNQTQRYSLREVIEIVRDAPDFSSLLIVDGAVEHQMLACVCLWGIVEALRFVDSDVLSEDLFITYSSPDLLREVIQYYDHLLGSEITNMLVLSVDAREGQCPELLVDIPRLDVHR